MAFTFPCEFFLNYFDKTCFIVMWIRYYLMWNGKPGLIIKFINIFSKWQFPIWEGPLFKNTYCLIYLIYTFSQTWFKFGWTQNLSSSQTSRNEPLIFFGKAQRKFFKNNHKSKKRLSQIFVGIPYHSSLYKHVLILMLLNSHFFFEIGIYTMDNVVMY